MKLTMADADVFKRMVKLLATNLDFAVFKVYKNELKIHNMDNAHVCYVNLQLKSGACIEYDQGAGSQEYYIDLQLLNKIMKFAQANNTLTLRSDNTKLYVEMKGARKTEFKIGMAEEEVRDWVQSDAELKIKVPAIEFEQAVEKAAVIDESTHFIIKNGSFSMFSSDKANEVTMDFPEDDDVEYELGELTNARARYASEYLKRIAPASKIWDRAEIAFSQDGFLELNYKETGRYTLQYILAPRISD